MITGAGSGENHIVSTNTGSNQFNGLFINNFVGANRFYQNGYTGSRSVVAVVEGGHIWNSHETLGHVSQFFDARQTYINNGVGFGQLGQFDRHATWVGQTIAGRNNNAFNYQQGIAYGAQLWSGSIGDTWTGVANPNFFTWTRGYAFTDAYAGVALTGRNGLRADVVNSSWGFFNIPGGNSIFALTYDGIAKESRSVFVASAGNNGPAGGTIGMPANGYNGIAVGALGNDLSNPPYNAIASFSSRGPQDYNGPDGFFPASRARVDIVAPGQNLTLAYYGGTTAGNTGGTDPSNGATDFYSFNGAGTSFSSPIVAGGAALLVDVARDRFASNVENARDGQVIKSVLLTSADKVPGWNIGLAPNGNGTLVTTQALDYTYGAGAMNLNKAFDLYTSGTTDLPGLGGGTIGTTGWDYGVVSQFMNNDYLFDIDLPAGANLSATLNWFVGRDWVSTASGGAITSVEEYFTDLSLQLWSMNNGLPGTMIGLSDAGFINTEHFSFQLPDTGSYMLRVNWDGERYDLVGNSSQTYGLAWNVSVIPEPHTMLLMLSASIVVRSRRPCYRTIRVASS